MNNQGSIIENTVTIYVEDKANIKNFMGSNKGGEKVKYIDR